MHRHPTQTRFAIRVRGSMSENSYQYRLANRECIDIRRVCVRVRESGSMSENSYRHRKNPRASLYRISLESTKHRTIIRLDESRDEVRGDSYRTSTPSVGIVPARDPIYIAPTFAGGNATSRSRVGSIHAGSRGGPRNSAELHEAL